MMTGQFRFLKKWCAIIFLAFLTWFLLHNLYAFYVGSRTPSYHADVAVILGNEVLADGSLSARLEARTKAGLTLFQKGMVDRIVVSGGKGKSGYYEADAMRDYLVAHGVPENKIIVDNHGDNTWLTATNLKALQQQYGFKSVIAVSQYFHVLRSMTTLKRVGFSDVQGYSPSYYELRDMFSMPREFVAYYVYWFRH